MTQLQSDTDSRQVQNGSPHVVGIVCEISLEHFFPVMSIPEK